MKTKQMKTPKQMKTTKMKLATVTAIALLLAITSCKSDDDNTQKKECFEHFNYDSSTHEGPADWANYCVAAGVVNECGSTVRQSPINIVNAVSDDNLTDLSTTYANSSTDILNNGHTIQFNYNGTATLNFDGEVFSLLQFHFHAESEHTVVGSHHPLEAHLVHKSASGNLAVIGVLFELGDENAFLAQFIDNLPEHKDDTYVNASLSYNALSLLSAGDSYFNYDGSLTTPPCSEIVEWIVMENPLEASQTQLDAFSNILHNNFRPIQPLNGRVIGHHTAG